MPKSEILVFDLPPLTIFLILFLLPRVLIWEEVEMGRVREGGHTSSEPTQSTVQDKIIINQEV